MTGNAAIAALVLTNLALIVGWVVSGTQRVAEDLVKERRARYLSLVAAVEKVRQEGVGAADLQPCVTAAEFVASDEMIDSGLVPGLAQAYAADETTWGDTRAAFLVAARHEAQNNQSIRRRLRRKALYGEPLQRPAGDAVPTASASPDDPPIPDRPVNPA